AGICGLADGSARPGQTPARFAAQTSDPDASQSRGFDPAARASAESALSRPLAQKLASARYQSRSSDPGSHGSLPCPERHGRPYA
uniref:Clade I nitrous oxide reductase n=1 Tax=Parastrongyloides trichosuri TaxID=131310 RepID=A0A0N4ZEE7_PARTI